MKQSMILDFDSTVIQGESLEILAEEAIRDRPASEREDVMKKLIEITNTAMEGKISFQVALEERLALFHADSHHIAHTITRARQIVSPSLHKMAAEVLRYQDQIYVVSGGFREIISPIITDLGMRMDHLFANTLIYKGDYVVDFDHTNPLCRSSGKAQIVKSLGLRGGVYVVGDGYTDLEVVRSGAADHFIAFTETVRRERVAVKADLVCDSFEEVFHTVFLT